MLPEFLLVRMIDLIVAVFHKLVYTGYHRLNTVEI